MVEVRRVDPEDMDGLKFLMMASIGIMEEERGLGSKIHAPMGDYMAFMSKYLLSAALNPDDYLLLVAEDGGKDVGGLVAEVVPLDPIYKYSRIATVKNIFVNGEARKGGAAASLMAEFMKWAKDIGMKAVGCTIHSGNEVPIKVLEDHGWNKEYVNLVKELEE